MQLREFKSLLEQGGYSSRPDKGSHSIWTHPAHHIVLCGSNHDTVPPYQLARTLFGRHRHRHACVCEASPAHNHTGG